MSQSSSHGVPADRGQERVIAPAALRELLVNLLVKQGMYQADAEIGADRMLEADIRGIHSHGSRALQHYIRGMDKGNIDPRAQITTVTEAPAMAVLDGGTGLGHVAATRGMELAIEKARTAGTGTVVVRNSQHFGAAGVYVLLAANAGMIGHCTTSTGGATVAAAGSHQAAVANHAVAWGAPVADGPPFVFDMAVGAVSWGKIMSFGMYGLPLPEGWAFTEQGEVAREATAAKVIESAGGARGYGLGLTCGLLSGALAGRKMPRRKTRSPSAEGSEHYFHAIDISQFSPREKFEEELAATFAMIRDLTPVDENQPVRIPGQIEHDRAEKWRQEGIPLHTEHVEQLEELAREKRVEIPW